MAFLGLACVGLEQRQFAGETLPEVVSDVRSMLVDSPAAEIFEDRLFEAGYLATHESRYQNDGYTVRFDRLFRVGDGFPRITEQDLAPGVGDVAYTLSLPVLEPFAADWVSMTELVGALRDHGGQ